MKTALIKRALYNLGTTAKRKFHILIVLAVFLLVGFPLVFSLCSSLVKNTGPKERNPAVKEALYLNSYARLKEKLTADKNPGKSPENVNIEIIFKEFSENVTSAQRYGKIEVLSLYGTANEGDKKDAGSKAASAESQKEITAKTPVKSLADSKLPSSPMPVAIMRSLFQIRTAAAGKGCLKMERITIFPDFHMTLKK
jgi:hypothetical protein